MEKEHRCKNCGAKLVIVGHMKTVECEHCGSVFELDENRSKFSNLYLQADDAWGRKDFDEAIVLYQQIVDEDQTQSEAHWGVALCRYGIAYEIDPIKYVEMPTCNRINRDSILNDKNYLAAIKYAGEQNQATYAKRAQEIDRISKEFLKIVDKEKPYDVFISYKRTDAEGRRTIDSQIAKKLYLFLTEQKINVFFAEETLRDVGGEKYEPYIFAALNSARVMVLFGSSKEYVNATWVKNEWRRFLILSQNDPKKVLIPVYIGRDPYAIMPQELLSIQAYDAASPVFHEEISENIRKKMGTAKEAAPKAAAKAGSSLAERYATPDKMDKLLKALDCDEKLAVNVLIHTHGNVPAAQKFIEEDPDYLKNMWVCAECGTKNTHDVCHNTQCGLSKKDSFTLRKMEQDAKERQKKKSAAYKAKRRGTVKKLIKAAIWLAIIGVVVSVVYKNIIVPNQSIKDGNYHTPEIVQSYCNSSSTNVEILTITDCTADGKVTATWEFLNEGNYGKVHLTGKIIDKKNNGNVEIEWTQQTPETMPANMTWENLGNITITNDWEKLKGTGNTLYAGSSDQLAQVFIETPEDLQQLSGASGFFMLSADIDMTGVTHTPIEGFTGTLVGNNHVIKNLTIDTDATNVGLFSTLQGTVSNLTIENASVTVGGRNEYVGILCGTMEGSLSGVTVSGTVNAAKCIYVGGIAGICNLSEQDAIGRCTSSASVTGLSNVGGIAGKIFHSNDVKFESLENSGEIIAEEDYAGGIAGVIDRSSYSSGLLEVHDCKNTGNVTGRYYVAGLIGYGYSNNGSSLIKTSSSAASVTGDAYVGCIAGYLYGIDMDDCQNIGSTMNVAGSESGDDGERYAYVGGFIGIAKELNVTNCTNEVAISYTGGGHYVGGIAGRNEGASQYKNVSNTADISGATYVGGIAGYLGGSGLSVEAVTNSGNITASGDYAAGLIGYFRREGYGNPVHIYDSENTGNVKGNTNVGGIVGYADANQGSSINNSTNTGTITGGENSGQIVGYAGEITINENG